MCIYKKKNACVTLGKANEQAFIKTNFRYDYNSFKEGKLVEEAGFAPA